MNISSKMYSKKIIFKIANRELTPGNEDKIAFI